MYGILPQFQIQQSYFSMDSVLNGNQPPKAWLSRGSVNFAKHENLWSREIIEFKMQVDFESLGVND